MTEILDNRTEDTTLGTHLRRVFPIFDSMDVATGYFNLRGWSAFADMVDEKVASGASGVVARILIGMVRGSEHQQIVDAYQAAFSGEAQAVDRTVVVKRREALVSVLREQLMKGIPTEGDRQALQDLHRHIHSGAVEVKVYCREPLHGKTYIFHREDPTNPVTGFIGSSNLTFPGLFTNRELNTDITDKDGARKLAQWFEELWTDRWALKIDDHVLDLLDESWASPKLRDPYEVYLKVCYDLSRDAREGLAEYQLHGRIKDELLEFQATAVKTLARRIMTRGGTMLGDVVGLGKTLTAVAVALMLHNEHGYQPLVLCPKNLQEMWEKHLKAYDLHGKVVPYSMSHTLKDLRRYRFVIVDESHTLRNENTQTYQHVARYISENDSKALLLTATPFNIKYADVANQLGLFLDEDEDLGVQPRMALAQRDFADKLEFGVNTLAAFRKSEHPEDWKRLMGEHLVRRTRSFIRDNYAQVDADGRQFLTFANGQRFFFPTRVSLPWEHDFSDHDPAALMVSDMTLDAMSLLSLPRYDLARFVKPSAVGSLSEGERKIVDDIERSRGHVAGFVRTGFYKRLSSCGHSFILSLYRYAARNRLFIYALDNDLPLPVGDIDASIFLSDEDGTAQAEGTLPSAVWTYGEPVGDPGGEYELLRQRPPAGMRWLPARVFTQNLRQALVDDNRIIDDLLAEYGPWSVEVDSKLQAVVDLVMGKHAGEKVLIFTEYKDTAHYLADALRQCGVDRVGVATGDTENPTAVARCFSPVSNSKLDDDTPVAPEDELRVLVATDVLSEGQNLQDAHIVVNYDIPWAIISLIQRAGRVDRVGQTSDTVLIYTLTHGGVEEVLHLRQRVQQRLTNNAATFGSDESFFDSEQEVNVIRDLYEGRVDEVSQEDDVDAASLAFEVWNRVAAEDPHLAARVAALPDLVDATRPARLGESDGVLCYVQSESGMDAFARAEYVRTGTAGAQANPSQGDTSEHLNMWLLSGHEALHAFEVSPDVRGLERIDGHDHAVAQLVVADGPLQGHQDLAGRLRGERKIVWNRLRDQLDIDGEDPLFHEALDALHQKPLTVTATNRLRRLRRHGATDQDLRDEIRALFVRGELSISSTQGEDSFRIVSVMGVKNV